MVPFAHAFLLRVEADVEVGAGAEHFAVPGQDDAADAVVDVDHGEDAGELVLHDFGEGIVVLGPVERHDDDGRRRRRRGRDVRDGDLRRGQRAVGRREGDGCGGDGAAHGERAGWSWGWG